ncbi:hypothetical protein FACS189434_08320 [Bacteroidia bacterium]|nr:hypothetical protein FACS189434_08320 [Bacteroidia bacterium]
MFGATITSISNNNWNNTATWAGGVVPGADDDVIIQSTVTINTNFTCKSITINSGELKWQNNNYNITVNGDFTINNGGKFTHNNNAGGPVYLYGDFVYNGGTYDVTTQGATNVIIHMLKAGSKITGTSATELHFMNLTINPPSAADTIYLDRENITINSNGTLTLAKGTFKVGATHALVLGTSQNVTLDASGGGNFATTGENGADGGDIIAGVGNGTITIKGTGALGSPTLYNFYRKDLNKGGNWHVRFDTEGVLIKGIFSNTDLIGTAISGGNQWNVDGGGKSPVYGPLSTFIRIAGNQQYTPGKEWTSITPGTIGVTPGYPNNVILASMGTSSGDNCGFNMPALAVNGTLTLGLPNATNNDGKAFVLLDNKTIYCGGLTINSGSYLRPKNTSTIYVGGDWNLLGGTGNVNIYPSGTPNFTVIFNGGKTAENPQLVYNSSGSESFGNLAPYGTVQVKDTYVKLNTPVTIQSSKTLTLNNGIIETDAVNKLTILNTAVTALSGGSPTAYINGLLVWNIAAGNYAFPVGKGESYLPLALTDATATTITVEAFTQNSGGTPNTSGATPVYFLDDTRYWALTSSADLSGSKVSIAGTEPLSTDPLLDKIAVSSTVNGSYTAIGGTPDNNSGLYGYNSDAINLDANSTYYFTFASSIAPPAELYPNPETIIDFGTITEQTAPLRILALTGRYLFENITITLTGENASAFTLVSSLDDVLDVPYAEIPLPTVDGKQAGIYFNLDKALANGTYTAQLIITGGSLEKPIEPIEITLTGIVNVSTGLNDTDADNATAYVIDGVLHIDNLPAGEVYGIYNVQGQQITAGKSNGASITLSLERKGVYIVTAGKKAIKIIG